MEQAQQTHVTHTRP